MNTNFLKIKEYLTELDYEIISEDSVEELVVARNEDNGIENLIVDCEDPIVIFELYLFDLANSSSEVLMDLLQKNRELVHGAFCIDESGEKVIFRDTLEVENLDLNEVEGTLNSLGLLLSEYAEDILSYAK